MEQWFPEMDRRAYFVPHVHLNRLRLEPRSLAGQEVLVTLPPLVDRPRGVKVVSESDARDDRETQRVLLCMRAVASQPEQVGKG